MMSFAYWPNGICSTRRFLSTLNPAKGLVISRCSFWHPPCIIDWLSASFPFFMENFGDNFSHFLKNLYVCVQETLIPTDKPLSLRPVSSATGRYISGESFSSWPWYLCHPFSPSSSTRKMTWQTAWAFLSHWFWRQWPTLLWFPATCQTWRTYGASSLY